MTDVKELKLKDFIVFFIIVICGVINIIADLIFNIDGAILDELVKILLPIIMVLAGVWVTCYLLYFQIYRDRYPMNIIKTKHLGKMLSVFACILFLMVFGCFSLVFSKEIFVKSFFCLATLIVIIDVLLQIYQTNKSFMVNSYVDEFCVALKKELDNSNNTINNSTFNDVRALFDESIVKAEYSIAQNITEKIGDIFREFLESCIGMIGSGAKPESIENSYRKIIDINMYQLSVCDKINSQLLIDRIVRQQKKNLQFCIRTNQYEWFKIYLSAYNRELFEAQKDGKSELAEEFFSLYIGIFNMLAQAKKYEWIESVTNELASMTSSLMYAYNNVNLCAYSKFLSGATICSFKLNDEKVIQLIDKSLLNLTKLIFLTRHSFRDIKIYFNLIFQTATHTSPKKALSFLQMLNNSHAAYIDSDVNEFLLQCYYRFYDMETVNDTDLFLVLEQHIETLCNIISLKEQYQGTVLLPDFHDLVFERRYNSEDISKVVAMIRKLLNYSIEVGNFPAYYAILQEVNELLSSTHKQQKDIQIKLFDIYRVCIRKTRDLTSKQFGEITFSSLKECIAAIDKERAISNDLAEFIISSLSKIAISGYISNTFVVSNIIGVFMDLLSEDNTAAFLTDIERKQQVFRGVFNIGTNCIESNDEEGLRHVSNALGWFIIYSIRQQARPSVLYLLDRASELLSISKKMDIGSTTKIFMLTLFTTVGPFCCLTQQYKQYLAKVISCIQDESIERVRVALSLRTVENDIWNDLYDNQTKELTAQFLSAFLNARK